jgi:hypothetical protein
MISKETIKEFKEALAEDYGREVSFDVAESILRGTVKYINQLAEIDHRLLDRSYSDPSGVFIVSYYTLTEFRTDQSNVLVCSF